MAIKRNPVNRKLRLESLEAREVFAGYIVTATDGATLGDALISILREADATPEPDTIVLPAGRYVLPAGRAADALRLNTSIELQGKSPALTQIFVEGSTDGFRISGSGQLDLSNLSVTSGEGAKESVLEISRSSSAQLHNVVMIVGQADKGGIIKNSGDLRLENVAFVGGIAIEGGAIYNEGNLVGNSVTFVDNKASGGHGGGGLFSSGTAELNRSYFVDNRSQWFGGGVSIVSGEFTLAESIVTGNSGPMGGGISTGSGIVDVAGSIVAGNLGPRPDIAKYNFGTSGTLLNPTLSSVGTAEEASLAAQTRIAVVANGELPERRNLEGINVATNLADSGIWGIEGSGLGGVGVLWS